MGTLGHKNPTNRMAVDHRAIWHCRSRIFLQLRTSSIARRCRRILFSITSRSARLTESYFLSAPSVPCIWYLERSCHRFRGKRAAGVSQERGKTSEHARIDTSSAAGGKDDEPHAWLSYTCGKLNGLFAEESSRRQDDILRELSSAKRRMRVHLVIYFPH